MAGKGPSHQMMVRCRLEWAGADVSHSCFCLSDSIRQLGIIFPGQPRLSRSRYRPRTLRSKLDRNRALMRLDSNAEARVNRGRQESREIGLSQQESENPAIFCAYGEILFRVYRDHGSDPLVNLQMYRFYTNISAEPHAIEASLDVELYSLSCDSIFSAHLEYATLFSAVQPIFCY